VVPDQPSKRARRCAARCGRLWHLLVITLPHRRAGVESSSTQLARALKICPHTRHIRRRRLQGRRRPIPASNSRWLHSIRRAAAGRSPRDERFPSLHSPSRSSLPALVLARVYRDQWNGFDLDRRIVFFRQGPSSHSPSPRIHVGPAAWRLVGNLRGVRWTLSDNTGGQPECWQLGGAHFPDRLCAHFGRWADTARSDRDRLNEAAARISARHAKNTRPTHAGPNVSAFSSATRWSAARASVSRNGLLASKTGAKRLLAVAVRMAGGATNGGAAVGN